MDDVMQESWIANYAVKFQISKINGELIVYVGISFVWVSLIFVFWEINHVGKMIRLQRSIKHVPLKIFWKIRIF